MCYLITSNSFKTCSIELDDEVILTVRACGISGSDDTDECESEDDYYVKDDQVDVCVCDEDYCNGAEAPVSAASVAAALVFSVLAAVRAQQL